MSENSRVKVEKINQRFSHTKFGDLLMIRESEANFFLLSSTIKIFVFKVMQVKTLFEAVRANSGNRVECYKVALYPNLTKVDIMTMADF